MVQGLQRLMHYLQEAYFFWVEKWTNAAALCLATTSALDTGAESSYVLGLLSAVLLGYSYRKGPCVGTKHILKADQWAVILTYEAFDADDEPKRRQAESSVTRYFVTDVPGYVEHVLGDRGVETDRLDAWWANESPAFDGAARYYDDDDTQACLRRIYSDEGFGLAPPASRKIASVENAMKKATTSWYPDRRGIQRTIASVHGFLWHTSKP